MKQSKKSGNSDKDLNTKGLFPSKKPPYHFHTDMDWEHGASFLIHELPKHVYLVIRSAS